MITVAQRAPFINFLELVNLHTVLIPCSHHIRLLLPRTGWVLTRPPRPSFTLNIQLLRVYVWVSLSIGSSIFNVSYRVFPVGCWQENYGTTGLERRWFPMILSDLMTWGGISSSYPAGAPFVLSSASTLLSRSGLQNKMFNPAFSRWLWKILALTRFKTWRIFDFKI